MTAYEFPECNTQFGPPPGLDEQQVRTIPAYKAQVKGGTCDGATQVVVCYHLTPEEREVIASTGTLFITMLGGLAPHFPSLTFHDATHPA